MKDTVNSLTQEQEMLRQEKQEGQISPNDPSDRIIPDERKRRLDEYFEAFSIAVEGICVFLCDMRYDFSRWSAEAVESFGMPSEYMYGAGPIWEGHVHPEDRGTYHEMLEEVFSGKSLKHDMQYRAINAKGEYIVCTCRGVVLHDENGEPEYFCGTIREHGIHEQIDALTGLRNQYGFFEDVKRYLEQHRKFMVCMLGISRFSELNDVYGYQFGNLLLQKVGRYLFEHVGNSGVVYRLDGTRFAILSETRTEEIFRNRYCDLRAVFRDGFVVDEHFIILELNAGLLKVDSFDIDERTVFGCVNSAYEESKHMYQGDMITFHNYLNEDNQEWINKIQAIRASITRDCDNYYLTYQPVVDVHTERIIGAEALLRWEDEEYGLVPPDEFISVIEKDSLFPNLGQWILRTALMDAREILTKDPKFIISVNLSYTQIGRAGFVDSVLAILEETGFPPANLCLEITERCRTLDMDLLINVITALRGHGIHIALDDFGTGFSSVGLVRDLPLDSIKIDRSFVLDIETNEATRELIGSFARVAAIYKSAVCVEGIETEEMRQILLNYPVNTLQGFYYSRPVRIEEFHKLLEKEAEKE